MHTHQQGGITTRYQEPSYNDDASGQHYGFAAQRLAHQEDERMSQHRPDFGRTAYDISPAPLPTRIRADEYGQDQRMPAPLPSRRLVDGLPWTPVTSLVQAHRQALRPSPYQAAPLHPR